MRSKGDGHGAGRDEAVWLLGNRHPAADRSIGWHDRIPNLGDADTLIVDMTTLTEDSTYEIGRRALGDMQKSIRDKLLGGGGTIVVIMGAMEWAPPPDASTRGPNYSFDGSLDAYAYSNYHVLPTVPEITKVANGRRIVPDPDHHFKMYLDAVEHFGFYLEGHDLAISLGPRGPRFYLEKVDGQSVMDNSGHYLGFTLVMTEEGEVGDGTHPGRAERTGKLVFLPPYTCPAADAIGKILSACGNLTPVVLPAPGRAASPASAPGDRAALRERAAGPPGGVATTGPAPGEAGVPPAAAAAAGGGTDVFLSYHHEVKDSVARPLAKGLEKRGVTVWWDDEAIRISDTVPQKIKEGLDGARCGVAIVSRGYMDSAWGRTELGAMFGKGMPIFPVLFKVSPEEAQKRLPSISETKMRAWDDSPEFVMDEIANAIKEGHGVQTDHIEPNASIPPRPPSKPPFPASHSQEIANESRIDSRRMKVFISHAFGGDDEELAGTLKDDLAAAGLDGYLAEESQRYDLLLSDKIMQEIGKSGWLAAIITRSSQASASVHEEIGYALGRGVKVALMVEEGVQKSGVLVHGREYEIFRVPEFGKHSLKVARNIAKAPRPPPRQRPVDEAVAALLNSRNILSDGSADFAKNEYFSYFYTPLHGDDKPVILFTSCPRDLGSRVDVTSPEFDEWVRSTDSIGVDGQDVRILGHETRVDVKRLVAIERQSVPSADDTVLAYREFHSNGLFEFGTSDLFFDRNRKGRMEMHLCYVVGEFWSFLAQARHFYQRMGLDSPFSVYVSVRDSYRLHLGNYGDEALRSGPPPGTSIPPTHRKNISLPYDFKSVRGATDEEIARTAKKAAREVCNAYGKTTPKCYNKDGSFSWRLWHRVARPAAGGGRL